MEIGSVIFFAAGIICLVGASAIYLFNRVQHRKIMNQLDDMLESAMRGEFEESHYDESVLSLVETKMAHYLTASEVSAKNLEEEKSEIKELIADISHQTKTPISNILLYTELLGEQNLSNESMDCVKQLKRQSEKLNSLIQSLVKASRLEAGIMVLHPTEQYITPMLEEVQEEIRLKAEMAGVTVDFEINVELQAKL